MASEIVYQITNYRAKAGEVLPPFVVPPAKLAGRETATLTLTVDDPTADPPTDAKLMLTIDASDDGGASWYIVSSSWAGISGTMRVTMPIAGRRIRVSGHAELACLLDALVEVA